MNQIIICLLFFYILIPQKKFSQTDTSSVSGFRASRILSSYPNRIFPNEDYWANTGKLISEKFPGSIPAGIWIVGLFTSQDGGSIRLGFPNETSGVYSKIRFEEEDKNESYLNKFDESGLKVWLQIEPGFASVDTLIDIVLNRYKHHPCVVGFGVDVEWYEYTSVQTNGKRVTDSVAEAWERKVKLHNPSYTLFLKHYNRSWMPPKYRGEILFVNDSQDFNWGDDPFKEFIDEFKQWGKKFSPAKTAYQFGYKADTTWWKKFNDPFKVLGDSLFSAIPNCYGVFWVDFTLVQLFPITSVFDSKEEIRGYSLQQNYPNPFNNSTIIDYVIPESDNVLLKVYDILGNEVFTLINKMQSAGKYQVRFDFNSVSDSFKSGSGIYLYTLVSRDKLISKKMIYLK